MDDIKPNSLRKAITKLVGQAVQTVQEDERMQQYAQLAAAQQQAQSSQNFPYGLGSQQQAFPYSGPTYGMTTTAATNTYGTTLSPFGMGGAPSQYTTYTSTGDLQPAPSVTLTDLQMSTLLAKVADLLTKGWECLRCHRIWSPRETGCEFCNFIDRLEGKDVERDSAA